MTIPPEIALPIKDFISKRWITILIVMSCILAGYLSVVFLGKDNAIEKELDIS